MRWLTAMLVGMTLAVGWVTKAEAANPSSSETIRIGDGPPKRLVPYRVIPMEDFAAFAKDWDNRDGFIYPTRTAVIRNREDWDEVFAPAVVMGDKRPVAPDEAFFEKETLLVVAKVTPPAPEGKNNLSPWRLVGPVGKDGVWLTLLYCHDVPETGNATKMKEGMLVKNVLLVAVKKDEVPANDKAIGFTWTIPKTDS